jgi:hypothetical protein
MSRGVCLFHDNAVPITRMSPLRMWKNASRIYWTIRRTVRTSLPAISTSFFHIKKHFAGKKFDDEDELQGALMKRFRDQAADFYVSGIYNVDPRSYKHVDIAGDYVEK